MRFAIAPLAFVLVSIGGCSKSSWSSSPPPCVDDASGYALPVGGQCLRITSARVRSGGTWRDISPGGVKVEDPHAVGVYVSASAVGAGEAIELTIVGAKGSAMLQQGYQSWSFSGATKIPDSVPLAADGAIAAKAASTGDPLDEVIGVSYGAVLIGDPGGGPAVALGAVSSDVGTTAFAVTGAGSPTIKVLFNPTREPLDPGPAPGRVASETIRITGADSAVDALAALEQSSMGTPSGQPSTHPIRPVGGWYSWNQLFDQVTENDVRAHIDLVATKLAPLGMPLVEIDDGWEVAWGDWRANAKFPSGMDGVGKAITDKALKAGVWLAPFLVDVTSDVAKSTDPSLFVHGADGKPLQHKPSGSSKYYYVLDGTNPDSMKLVTDAIATLAKDGFTFFKLDFLYAGALPGVRKDAKATGTEALHRGLALLRTAMGDGATFNACGAPIFPLLGYADSMRIGSDTAYSALSLNWNDVVFAARSTAARSFLAPLVWLDGDQTQVRDPYTLDEAKASAFVAAMSGPAYALGDDLRTLPADRLAIALDPEVLDLAGANGPAIPVDPLESPADAIVASPVLDAITNPGSTGAPPPTKYTMKGKSGASYTLTFGWTDVHSVTVAK